MPDWLTLPGAIAGAFVGGGLFNYVHGLWSESKRTKKELAVRLRLFALEAVELQERFVQYVRQVFEQQISSSTPFELTTPEQVNDLIRLGGSDETVQAIYFVKELANDVRRNVTAAQDQTGRAVPAGSFAPDPQAQFNCAAAFIRDRWDRVSGGIETILDAAAKHGCDVGGLRKNFEKQSAEYQSYRPRLEAAKTKRPPKEETVTGPSK
jgi:hypothetical protein